MPLEVKQTAIRGLAIAFFARVKTFGFGTIFGIIVFSAACYLPLQLIPAINATQLADAAKLSLNLGINLTIFGAILLWVMHPLMGHLHLEDLAQRVAHLCVLFGLTMFC